MPQDPQSDQDFQKAPRDRQHAYLMATDPDYAKATPDRQAAYLKHVSPTPYENMPGAPSTQPMEESNVGIAMGSGNTERSAIMNPQQPAEQFGLEHPEEQGKLAAASAIGAAGTGGVAAAPAIIPPMLRAAAKHPYITNAILSSVIAEGRKIPVVGKMIPPMAEMLPWLRGGGAEAAPEGDLDATGENKPFAGGEDEYVAPQPKFNNPGAPDPTMPPEIQRSQGLRTGSQPAPEPSAPLGRIPGRPEGRIMDQAASKAAQDMRNMSANKAATMDKFTAAEKKAAQSVRDQATIQSPIESSGDPILDRLRVNAARIRQTGHGDEPIEPSGDLSPEWQKALDKLEAAKFKK